MTKWTQGSEFTLTIVYLDPALTVAASFDVLIKSEETYSVHKPVFNKPLRPGVWTVRLIYSWELVAETRFLVTPLLYYNQQVMPDEVAVRIHSGPDGLYTDRDFHSFHAVLQVVDTLRAEREAAANAAKTGEELRAWVTQLVQADWTVSDTCFVGDSVPSSCPGIKPCDKTTWSSYYPDPKSEVGELDPHTHRFT